MTAPIAIAKKAVRSRVSAATVATETQIMSCTRMPSRRIAPW